MDAKKKISSYIGGANWILIVGIAATVVGILTIATGIGALVLIVGFFFLIYGLCAVLPANVRMKKNLAQLELNGQLEKAAEEMDSPNKKVIGKNKAIMTENYLFGSKNGVVIALSDVVWAYKYRLVQRAFLIPIRTNDSLMIGDGKKNPIQAINMGGKDKNDELKDIILEMYRRNPERIVGYNAENAKAYKALRKQNV